MKIIRLLIILCKYVFITSNNGVPLDFFNKISSNLRASLTDML